MSAPLFCKKSDYHLESLTVIGSVAHSLSLVVFGMETKNCVIDSKYLTHNVTKLSDSRYDLVPAYVL